MLLACAVRCGRRRCFFFFCCEPPAISGNVLEMRRNNVGGSALFFSFCSCPPFSLLPRGSTHVLTWLFGVLSM